MLNEHATSPGYAGLVVDSPDDFQVHTRVYTDPQVFAAEMANIFEKTWVYVAYESEIAQPGDYKRQLLAACLSSSAAAKTARSMCC
jgi:benzoate/toluate 1,2-dioxygenase subunit alpha